jgi:hypothetical protein
MQVAKGAKHDTPSFQMADLERCYDEEAGRLRAAFVAEVAQLYQSEAA